MTAVPEAELDAYTPCPGQVFSRGDLVVRRRAPAARQRSGWTHTPTFDVRREREKLVVEHDLCAETISDDLAGLLSVELFDPGWLRGPEMFEEVFVGVVLTCAPDAQDAWNAFYRNTLDRIDRAIEQPGGSGSIAAYAPVHAHVAQLVRGTRVLEVGTCFGFQALRLARAGYDVTASDLSPGVIALLTDMSRRLGLPVRTRVLDATRLDAGDSSVDTVLAIHLLEHLEPDAVSAAIREACRVARRRVVVAVPFEDEPAEQFGHLRPLGLADLEQWGRAAGWSWRAHEHHGGWLVLDPPA